MSNNVITNVIPTYQADTALGFIIQTNHTFEKNYNRYSLLDIQEILHTMNTILGK